ncbi:MAG: CoA transferase, partial [Proteobacteria bacterium]|nr:CoA transferase [Pseudomonadota bacterium]
TNRNKLNANVDKVFGALSRPELSKVLKQAKIAFGALNSVADFSKHPQLRRMALATPAGEIHVVAPPVKVVGNDLPVVLPVPATGAHSKAIAREFS